MAGANGVRARQGSRGEMADAELLGAARVGLARRLEAARQHLDVFDRKHGAVGTCAGCGRLVRTGDFYEVDRDRRHWCKAPCAPPAERRA
ncbi:MAG: hypothetical protein AB7H93_23525 [Vicinamibacterales bacterium]